jgi:RNA polymerase sigma-70 factor (ECF subfamily)
MSHSLTQPTPRTLLERLCRANDSRDWERFVELYTPVLFHWVRKLGLPPADAADAVQDVFLQLTQKLPAFRYDRSQRFRGWLWTLVRNKVADRRRCRPNLLAGAADRQLESVAAGDPLDGWAEAEYRRHLAARALEVMKAEFEETTWRACWEYVAQGRPASEVAAELGVTVDVVYQAKSRVLRRLKHELDGLFE